MKITRELLFTAIADSMGYPERAFRKAGVPADEARAWLKEKNLEKQFEQACKNQLDIIVERMEKKLIEKGENWDVPAIKKFLEAKAQHLGYGEKIEMEVNVPLTLQIVKKYKDGQENIIDITPTKELHGPNSSE